MRRGLGWLALAVLPGCAADLDDFGVACVGAIDERGFPDRTQSLEIEPGDDFEVLVIFDPCSPGRLHRESCTVELSDGDVDVRSEGRGVINPFGFSSACRLLSVTCQAPAVDAGEWRLDYGITEFAFEVPYSGDPFCTDLAR